MNYAKAFAGALQALKDEGRYRGFTDIRRTCGDFPSARHFAEHGARPITVWCSNDYLGMGQNQTVLAAMHVALDGPAPAPAALATSRVRRTTTWSLRLSLPTCTARRRPCCSPQPTLPTDDAGDPAEVLPGCVILSDEQNHASMIAGIRSGGGEKPHLRATTISRDLREPSSRELTATGRR